MPSQQVLFEALQVAGPDALVGVDQAGMIRYVNRRAELLFGYEHEVLIGQSVETLVPESFRSAHQAQRADFAASPKTREMGTDLNLNGRHRDGTEFPVDVSLTHTDTAEGLLVIAAVRDMTNRRKAEAGRRRSDREAAAIEFSGEAISTCDTEGIITSWNPAAERLFGYSGAEIIGSSENLLSLDDQSGGSMGVLAKMSNDEPVQHLETLGVRKDGTVLRVAFTIAPIFGADGAVIGASTITRDLTKQSQALEAARSMIESSLDSLVAISPEGMITDANEATVKVTGIPRGELIGTAFSDYFTDSDKANAIYQLVFEQGMAVDYPLTMRHRDGTLTEVLYNASVYRDAGGKVLGVFAAARDVTKQRQAGAQYTRSLIEAALDPLVTISPDGKITDVNEATVNVTGVPREELIGTEFSDYFTEPDLANEGYQLAFAQGSVTDYPLTLRHRDGALIDVLYNASVYRDASGNVLGVFAAARDVTEQKQAQAAIARQAKELDRLADLERFQRLTVGRELKMIELKKEIEILRSRLPAEGGDGVDEH